jgi:23S rRNA pseudouridine1911/1915/1917 synthase
MAGHLNNGWIYRDRVDGASAGKAVVDFYAERYRHSTREAWQQRIETGLILADGRRISADEGLTPGQLLTYARPPWQEPDVPRQIDIVHEDTDLIVANKPSGLPVLPAGGEYLENTMVALIRSRYSADLLPPAPIHRLGRGTSGLVLFARSAIARRVLSQQIAIPGGIEKRYRALVQGTPLVDRFVVEEPIGKIPYPALGFVHAAVAEGKKSRSEVSVCESRGTGDTLVNVDIPTGRPHQIRIHMAVAGHPLVGEPLYAVGGRPHEPAAGEEKPSLPGDCGYHLHAMRLRFRQPRTFESIAVYCQPPAILGVTGES